MPSAESMRPIACARLRSPLDAIDDARVLEQVVAHVANIEPAGADAFDVTIRVAFGTTGFEAGQLMSTLFGNPSPGHRSLWTGCSKSIASTYQTRFGLDRPVGLRRSLEGQ
jgi:hypothetical protein